MVIGHLLYDSNHIYLSRFIYSFHMPLFFLLSGYVYKPELGKMSIKKRIQRLLIPFIAFAIIGIPFFGLYMRKNGGTWLEVLVDTFYINGETFNSPLWFLIALFEVYIIFEIARISEYSIHAQVIIYVISLIVGYFVYTYKDVLTFLNILGINRAIICLSFFVLGYSVFVK